MIGHAGLLGTDDFADLPAAHDDMEHSRAAGKLVVAAR